MTPILHLVPAAEYHRQPPDEPFRAASLAAEGFIHCTREREVLLHVANRFYRAQPGEFLVLVIDAEKVTAPVKLETPAPSPDDTDTDPLAQHLFPHIYGPLNREAIVEVHPVRRAADGTFVEV